MTPRSASKPATVDSAEASTPVVETAEVFCTRGGRLVRGSGFPPHPERYAATGVDLVGLLAGEA